MKTTICMGCFAMLVAASIVTAQQQAQQAESGQRTDTGQRVRTAADEAQRDTDREQRRVQQPAAQRQQEEVKQIASILALANHAEIELGRLALQRSQNEQVQQFAKKMVEDHSKQLDQLRQFTPQIEQLTRDDQREARPGARTPQNRDQTPQDRERTQQDRTGTQQDRQTQQTGADAQTRQRDPQATPRAQARQEARQTQRSDQHEHSKMLQIAKQASQKKLQMTKDMLSELDEDEFDMGYMAHQVIAHIAMVAQLEAVQNVGPQEFQQVNREGLQTAQEHLQHAKALAKQLKQQDRAPDAATRPRTARQPAAQPQRGQQPRQQEAAQPRGDR